MKSSWIGERCIGGPLHLAWLARKGSAGGKYTAEPSSGLFPVCHPVVYESLSFMGMPIWVPQGQAIEQTVELAREIRLI